MEILMNRIFILALGSLIVTSLGACALNPFAADNIYKRKNTESTAGENNQRSAGDLNANFELADANRDGVISKQEAERVPGLAAVFDQYNQDRDGSLDWNEFTAAMKSKNLSRN
jgi:EF hand